MATQQHLEVHVIPVWEGATKTQLACKSTITHCITMYNFDAHYVSVTAATLGIFRVSMNCHLHRQHLLTVIIDV